MLNDKLTFQMVRLCSFVLVVIYFGACNSSHDSQTKRTSAISIYQKDTLPNGGVRYRPNYSVIELDTSEIKLDFFQVVPETISSVGEFYTYDTTELASNKYIFLTDLTEYAIVRNQGRDIYLRKEHEKCLVLPEDTFQDVFSGNGNTISFTHKRVGHKKGATYETGMLEIANSKHKVTIKIHGGYKI